MSLSDEDLAARLAELEQKKMKRDKKNAKMSKTKKKNSSADTSTPGSDVDICNHLTTLGVIKIAVWSGEIEHYRNGVLTNSQAWGIVTAALLLPCLGGGGTGTLKK